MTSYCHRRRLLPPSCVFGHDDDGIVVPREGDEGDDGEGGETTAGKTATTTPLLSADDGSGIVAHIMPPLMRTTMTIVAAALFSTLLLSSRVVDARAAVPPAFRSTTIPTIPTIPTTTTTTRRRRPLAALRTPLPESRPSSSSSSSKSESSSESESTPPSSSSYSAATILHIDIDPPSTLPHHHHHAHHHQRSHDLRLLRHHHHAVAWPTTTTTSSSSSSSSALESTLSSPVETINVHIIDPPPSAHHHRNLQLLRHHRRDDHAVVAFYLTPDMPPTTTTTTTTTAAAASRTTSTTPPPPSHVLTVGEMGPVFEFKSKRTGNPKVLNLHGLRHLLVIVLSMPLWMIGLEVVHALGDAFPGFDDDRGKFDAVGKVWCRAYLGATGCYPSVGGDVGRLSVEKGGVAGAGGGGGPCLFVANHASFLDIAVICCALGPTFKFIAKDSLEKFPGVGRQLVGGEHLLINRDDKRSQLRMFKRARKYLEDGVSIMAFPEGARSPDGRLMGFKGGMFSLAIKTGVPIVPLSLANTHAVFPPVGFLPVQDGRGKLRVYVHDPIDVAGKDEGEIAAEVRRALLSELPWDQHPLAAEGGDGAVGG